LICRAAKFLLNFAGISTIVSLDIQINNFTDSIPSRDAIRYSWCSFPLFLLRSQLLRRNYFSEKILHLTTDTIPKKEGIASVAVVFWDRIR